jgi:DNA-binding CsgD family transcriptional regulator
MHTGSRREGQCREIETLCGEVMTLEEVCAEILPLLERLVGASTSVVYRCRERNQIDNVGGQLTEAGPRYSAEHYAVDPMQSTMRRENARILHGPLYPEWGRMLRTPVYGFLVRNEAASYLHVRLTDTEHHAPGKAGLQLARAQPQRDFDESDKLLLARVLPALEGVARRDARLEAAARARTLIGAIAEADAPKLAFATDGAMLWASPRAEVMVDLRAGIAPLAEAVRRLRPGAPRTLVVNGRKGPVRVELRASGEAPWIVARLESLELPGSLAAVALRAQLTEAETAVLGLVSRGLSNREIARRRGVLPSTVFTHVARILSKLQVRSRVQAALVARGLDIDSVDGDDD